MAEVERMRMLTDQGERVISVEKDSTAASWIGGHWNAIKVFRDEGDRSLLVDFEIREIHLINEAGEDTETLRFATDPQMIRKWAKQGELDLDDPYEELDGTG